MTYRDMPRKYLGLESLDDLAMKYAMLASPDYTSSQFSDPTEHRRARLWHEMCHRFGTYPTSKAIESAVLTLRLVDFHPKD